MKLPSDNRHPNPVYYFTIVLGEDSAKEYYETPAPDVATAWQACLAHCLNKYYLGDPQTSFTLRST